MLNKIGKNAAQVRFGRQLSVAIAAKLQVTLGERVLKTQTERRKRLRRAIADPRKRLEMPPILVQMLIPSILTQNMGQKIKIAMARMRKTKGVEWRT